MADMIKLTKEFEEKNITTITFRGRPAWLSLEIGRALGYSENGNRLAKKITQDWSDEIIEGRDCTILSGEELSELKQLLEVGENSVLSSYAPHAMLLFESGLHFVCLRTNSPIGRKLR